MSQRFYRALDWLVHSHLFIGLCALALTAHSSETIIGLRLSPEFGLLVFSGTVALYSIHRYGQSRVYGLLEEMRSQLLTRFQKLYLISFAVFAIVATLIFMRYFRTELFWFVPPAILGFLYVMPWNSQWKRIRDLPFVKIWMITLCWVWITVMLPVIYINENFLYEPDLWMHAIEKGALIIAITLPFDLRDEQADRLVGLHTFVTSMGSEKARYLALSMLLISSLCTMYAFLFMGNDLSTSWSMWITQFIAMILIMNASAEKPDVYFSIGMDGVLIIPWIVYHIWQFN